MEPERLLQHSQVLATCSYPVPDQSNPRPPPTHNSLPEYPYIFLFPDVNLKVKYPCRSHESVWRKQVYSSTHSYSVRQVDVIAQLRTSAALLLGTAIASVFKIFALLGCYTTFIGSSSPTFGDTLFALSSLLDA